MGINERVIMNSLFLLNGSFRQGLRLLDPQEVGKALTALWMYGILFINRVMENLYRMSISFAKLSQICTSGYNLPIWAMDNV